MITIRVNVHEFPDKDMKNSCYELRVRYYEEFDI